MPGHVGGMGRVSEDLQKSEARPVRVKGTSVGAVGNTHFVNGPGLRRAEANSETCSSSG